MHADEVATDVSLVRRLIAGQFPEWAQLPVERFPSAGTVNAVYRLGADMAVRLPLRSESTDVESRWLPRLAPLLPVAIPTVLGTGMPAEGYPWSWFVHRWLDGENPVVDDLADPDLLATDMADFVAAMRRIELPDGPAAYRGGPLATVDTETRAAIEDLHGMIDTEAATRVWDAALAAPDWPSSPVWVHSDLMPGNLLIGHGRLSGVIDFGTVGIGDPACDLIVAWNLLPPGARAVFRAALNIDDATWVRGRGRALSMALIQLPYYQVTNPVIAANARHVIHQVLAAR